MYMYSDWTEMFGTKWPVQRYSLLKPMHNIGKVSVNASILYKNQEICNKTNL